MRQDHVGAHPGPLPELRRGSDRHSRAASARAASSCRRDGGGSLDVVEIDAASHNGVDDARDLRERAVFAPARDRYKIFILDEAHMVTPQGFNALLKIVEEPPEHVKFIFATTEPEKVIGTIRSPHAPLPVPAGAARADARVRAAALRRGEGHRRARRAAARRPCRRRLGARHALAARPTHRRLRRNHHRLRARGRAARLHALARCSARSSMRSALGMPLQLSPRSTGSSRPARTRAGSSRTCSSASATSSSSRRPARGAAAVLRGIPEDELESHDRTGGACSARPS